MDTPQKIRIGTRGSPLALTQAEMVRAALAAVAPEVGTEIVVIKTSGDWRPADGETRLAADDGGKGLFAKEIEAALLAGQIECAVHSMKDMETFLPEGLSIPVMLPREDARDCLLLSEDLRKDVRLDADDILTCLPQGATVGTASVRRQAFLLARRPDLKIVPLRGNVHTRIEKVRSGQVDATLLALAGLKRLKIEHEADVVLNAEFMLPSAAQGAIGVEILTSNNNILALISQINDRDTLILVSCERAALAVLDGSCHTPIGAYAELKEKRLYLRLVVAALDGGEIYEEAVSGEAQNIIDAENLGRTAGENLKSKVPARLFSQHINDEEL